jgi:hypothetical protein
VLADPYNDFSRVIVRIRTLLEARPCAATAEVLGRLSEQDLRRNKFTAMARRPVPAARFLPETISATMMLDASLAAELAVISDSLAWQRSPDYSDELLGEGFCDNYGWATLIGAGGCFPGDDFELGLFLLGPGLFYPGHYHPAPELYLPLTGGSQWQQGGSAFAAKEAGAIIWHAPHVVHATRTGREPLLAVWCWTRNIRTPPRLVMA